MDPVTSSGLATPSRKDAPETKAISSDFETFLKMLTVQMQNQDPLDPVDSADYATQLATFSGVEQQVQTNDLLRSISGQLVSGGLSDLAAWVGKEIRTEAPLQFAGAPLSILPDVAAGADSARLVVSDSSGNTVQTIPIPTDGSVLSWTGKTEDGHELPNGKYTFEVESVVGGELIATKPASSYAMVSEVRIDDGQSMIVLGSGQILPTDAVSAIRDPALMI